MRLQPRLAAFGMSIVLLLAVAAWLSLLRAPASPLPSASSAPFGSDGAAADHGVVRWRGVNLSGAEFGPIGSNPRGYGERGRDYAWPSDASLHYWVRTMGANVVRIPFRWERIQPALRGPLDRDELGEMQRVVGAARALGAVVILDLHNFGNRWVGDGPALRQAQVDGPSRLVSRADFADLWTRLARTFANDPGIHFDLMNEPHGMRALDDVAEPEQVRRLYQAAIDGIRGAGAHNPIHINPAPWAHPESLTGDFAGAALALQDPDRRLLFQLHVYLDARGSGTDGSLKGNDLDAGVARVRRVTEWARQRGLRLFLGEFGLAGDNPRALEAARRMIDQIGQNGDVWAGWSAWGAGDRWRPDYHYALQGPAGGAPALLRSLLRPSPQGATGAGEPAREGGSALRQGIAD